MVKRFVSIWFPYLETDWHQYRRAEKCHQPFVTAAPSHGKMVVASVNSIARTQGIVKGMALADARAIYPSLQVADHEEGTAKKLITRIAEWCIRFSPFIVVDGVDGIIIDATGCSHLWGGDENYINEIMRRIREKGFHARIAMADTIGAAWAHAHYGEPVTIVSIGKQAASMMELPPESLRLDSETTSVLHRLGLQQISRFMNMPSRALRRRFGGFLIKRLAQALGKEEEMLSPIQPVEPYQKRLPCLEPVKTAKCIEIAFGTLLKDLCTQLRSEEKGLRCAKLHCYNVDHSIQTLSVQTSHATSSEKHVQKLFSEQLSRIEPKEGIELFILEAPIVEDHAPAQEAIWDSAGANDHKLSELVDRITQRIGEGSVQRFKPAEHYWPERSFTPSDLYHKENFEWRSSGLRPAILLHTPEPIDVTAPIPDYPPMLFRHKGKLHKIMKADGPERIEQEWWIQHGKHRDYYAVEDEEGNRYWLFRSGHYGDLRCNWFIHGYFP